jgi:TolB-like protein/tetratricopeptide (TPR) repeat protein
VISQPGDEETTNKSWQLDKSRITVLPFANISPDPADEYFADGMTEEIISTLCGISNLTVISRTSVMQFKGAKKNLADIGRELKSGTILEGSVRKAGNRVRITVQLLDVVEDKHLWTQSYDRELQDVFGVQSDIARRVAGAVKLELLSTPSGMIRKRPTASTEAYLSYLKGRVEWNKRSEEGARIAIEHFTQALHHDSNFPLAYVGLADSFYIMEARGAMTSAEATEKARRAISKALQMDERLAEAHASYARLLEYDRNWDAAEAEYLKAIELNPSYASAHQWYSFLLGEEGRWESALVEAEKALELDPLSAVMLSNVAHRLLFMERYDDALEYAKRSLEIQPDLFSGVVCLVLAYAYKGESVEAVARWEEYSQTRPNARAMVFLAAVQALVGESDEALRTLDSASKLDDFTNVPPTLVAWVYAALHNEEKTLEWLEKALEKHDTMVTSINDNIVFKELHSRTRYREILKRLGLDKY